MCGVARSDDAQTNGGGCGVISLLLLLYYLSLTTHLFLVFNDYQMPIFIYFVATTHAMRGNRKSDWSVTAPEQNRNTNETLYVPDEMW